VFWRAVQDCERRYGAALRLAEVTRLDEYHFEQRVRTVIRPDRHWPGWRLHTLGRAGPLECIDGSALAWRSVRRSVNSAQEMSSGEAKQT
jgi:hypothetical protein